MENIELGYWDIKGWAEFVRLPFAYMGVQYTENNPNEEQWSTLRGELFDQGFKFSNLPYIRQGDFFLSESYVIAKYFARKLNRQDLLGGDDILKVTRFEEIQGVISDVRGSILTAFVNPEYAKAMELIVQDDSVINRKLGYLSAFLGEQDFYLGDQATLIDIYAAYMFYFLEQCFSGAGFENLVARHANLVALLQRVFELPGIKEYVQSDAWNNRILARPEHAMWLK